MSENFRGALLMMVCMGAFVLNDAFVRLAGNSLPLAQILFLRGVLTTLVLLTFAIYLGTFKVRVVKTQLVLVEPLTPKQLITNKIAIKITVKMILF